MMHPEPIEASCLVSCPKALVGLQAIMALNLRPGLNTDRACCAQGVHGLRDGTAAFLSELLSHKGKTGSTAGFLMCVHGEGGGYSGSDTVEVRQSCKKSDT
mmetsp:Transcript_114738/g.199577  ORF Transcript_114738/g.199577 Transcript_114738/m.199577 type:complete len:101 (-) Transcript_114738:251-553(-)